MIVMMVCSEGCHVWAIEASERYGRCGRCGIRPKIAEGVEVGPSRCLHRGKSCRKPAATPRVSEG